MMTQNGVPDTVERSAAKFDEIGGPLHENHYPVGWCWAGSSPFQWMKRVPHTSAALATEWLSRGRQSIKAKGGLRSQFHHLIDIAPTHLRPPTFLNPRWTASPDADGRHFAAYSFDEPDAK